MSGCVASRGPRLWLVLVGQVDADGGRGGFQDAPRDGGRHHWPAAVCADRGSNARRRRPSASTASPPAADRRRTSSNARTNVATGRRGNPDQEVRREIHDVSAGPDECMKDPLAILKTCQAEGGLRESRDGVDVTHMDQYSRTSSVNADSRTRCKSRGSAR